MFFPYKDQHLSQTLEWLDHISILNEKPVIEHAKMLLLDTLACVQSAYSSPSVKELESTFSNFDPGPFGLYGEPQMSALSVAQLFALTACWHEACEGHASAHGRPGIATLASIYPFANKVNFGQFLNAFVCGYEISVRFAQMLRIKPGMHVDGNWPSLGAAVAVGKCMEMSNKEILKSINMACTQLPMSLYLPIYQGAMSRNSYLGHAAVLGIQSAMSAKTSLSAPSNGTLEYAKVALQNKDPQWNSEENFEILNAYIKPFAAVRHVHYGAFAAIELRDQFELEDIEEIVLEIYEEATIYCSNRSPQTAIQAQFSLSFGIAAALIFKDLNYEMYDESILKNTQMIRLEKMIRIVVDPELTKLQRRGATLTIRDRLKTRKTQVNAILGDLACPMSQEQIKIKFMQYTKDRLGADKANSLWESVMNSNFSAMTSEVLLLDF